MAHKLVLKCDAETRSRNRDNTDLIILDPDDPRGARPLGVIRMLSASRGCVRFLVDGERLLVVRRKALNSVEQNHLVVSP